ncbi:hypothetical protein CBF23_002355 [Marinomonas agarivorans]|nr:hypothetical protein CBF23_002355 [Marinomonas agarivorans]
MVIIETPIFTKLITNMMSDADYWALPLMGKWTGTLIYQPDVGVLIRNSGGLRKMRWSLDSCSKRSGVRIIYYWMADKSQLYMLYIFSKNAQANLTLAQTKTLRQIVERWSL